MQKYFQTHKKELLIIGIGSSLAGYILYKIFSKGKPSKDIVNKPYHLLSKQQVMDYFKDLKAEILGPLFDIVALREDLKSIYLKNGEDVSKEFLRKKIFPNLITQLKNKEMYLLKKHSLNPEDLEGSFRDAFSQDPDVMAIKKEIDITIENALDGISPSLDLPQHVLNALPPAKCYELTLEIMTKSLIKIRNLYVELKNEGVTDFSLGNMVVVEKSQALNLKKFKEEILLDKGLGNFNGSPVEIYTKTMHRYQDEEKEFRAKIDEIENNYQKVMEILSTNPEEITVEGIENVFYKNK